MVINGLMISSTRHAPPHYKNLTTPFKHLGDSDFDFLIERVMHERHVSSNDQNYQLYEAAKTLITAAKHINAMLKSTTVTILTPVDQTVQVLMQLDKEELDTELYAYLHESGSEKAVMDYLDKSISIVDPLIILTYTKCKLAPSRFYVTVTTKNGFDKVPIPTRSSKGNKTLSLNVHHSGILSYDMNFPCPTELRFLTLEMLGRLIKTDTKG